ncbi:hypothetical protein FG386_001549 [Cryptosporidium ryanae]|uniref:uncharacterized protein n=1 Tax=Cryptosporidium ryanae TaxID=515981 RepID=UPI00351A6139|nr:hypothetical protein FG386_001549 [Cryptosporidium ryanae]
MKDKILGEIKRGENDVKPHSNSVVSSFHADAPTFQPRSTLLIGSGVGNSISNSNPVISSNSNSNNSLNESSLVSNNEISSGLTATAQPFIPSSIRHNTTSMLDVIDHGFHISPNMGVLGGGLNINLGGVNSNNAANNSNNVNDHNNHTNNSHNNNESNNYSPGQINSHLNSNSLHHIKHGIMYSGNGLQEGSNLSLHHGGSYSSNVLNSVDSNHNKSNHIKDSNNIDLNHAVSDNSKHPNNIGSGVNGGNTAPLNDESVIETGGTIHAPGIEYDGILLGSSGSSSTQKQVLTNNNSGKSGNSGILVNDSGQNVGIPRIQYCNSVVVNSGNNNSNIRSINGTDSGGFYSGESGESGGNHHIGIGLTQSTQSHNHTQQNYHHQQHGISGGIGMLSTGQGQGQGQIPGVGVGMTLLPGAGAFSIGNVNNNNNNQNGNVLDLSEYCRRVRGWNLPFLRMIPQMNAITQIRHELQLQNISLLLTQNDILSMNSGIGGHSNTGVHNNNHHNTNNNHNSNNTNSNHHHGNSGAGQVQNGPSNQMLINQHQHYVPQIVQRNYYGLCLLDDSNIISTTRFCGYQTYAYKAINIEDYTAYCLRRIDNFPFSELDNTRHCLDKWHKLTQHPCIVSYRHCFASLDFPQGGALVVVYDYIPNASTMESVHFKEPIGEPLLWNYIIQIVLALVHIHSSQLAARVIDPTKLLISYRGRLRLNCVGILDFTRIDETKTIVDYQKQDLVALGYIILALCCGSLTIINDLNHAVEQIFLKSSMYSNDLKKLVLILLSKPALNKNNLDVFILANMLAARMIPQIEHSLKLTDALENEFRKEIDNGRLFRLLTKINTIADRSQLNSVHKWNETGDRYICKLFREYLFQQTDNQGRPVVDMGHILDSLAKVDVGTTETVTLMSSDGSSILLVSFADIKHSIEKSFCEIIASTTTNSNFNDL